jgi:hypothetical protein
MDANFKYNTESEKIGSSSGAMAVWSVFYKHGAPPELRGAPSKFQAIIIPCNAPEEQPVYRSEEQMFSSRGAS